MSAFFNIKTEDIKNLKFIYNHECNKILKETFDQMRYVTKSNDAINTPTDTQSPSLIKGPSQFNYIISNTKTASIISEN